MAPHIILRKIYTTLIFLPLLIAYPFAAHASNTACDDTFVQTAADKQSIQVKTTSVDDTENIQCALNAAANSMVSSIKLSAGTYYIKSIEIENFVGAIEGKGKTLTTIEVIDDSVRCGSQTQAGKYSAALKFVRGEPRLRFMTIRVNHPCNGGRAINSIVHFTGAVGTMDNCPNDVIFGVVDRVIIEGSTEPNSQDLAIRVGPEKTSCSNALLGSFKLNRSELINTTRGIGTSMKAGAQVDISFNTFIENSVSVWVDDSNQNTSIFRNKFYVEIEPSVGVFVTPDYSTKTRVVIHENEFNLLNPLDEPNSSTAIMISGQIFLGHELAGLPIVKNTSVIITNNNFKLEDAVSGIQGWYVSNVIVSKNNFIGSGYTAIQTSGFLEPVTGWTITDNTGFEDFISSLGADIRLNNYTSGIIIGPGQGAIVDDSGIGNFLLD